MSLPRPRLARETRLLLVTVVLSAATLLLLARFRYPDAPAPALPREQPLQRLAAEALFDELAATVSRSRSRLAPFVPVLQIDAAADAPGTGPRRAWVPALRFRDDLAIAAAGVARAQLRVLTTEGASDAVLVAEDRLRGFAVVRIREMPPLVGPPPVHQAAPSATAAGYAVAIDGAPGGPVARPVFVDRFDPVARALWPAARALPASLRPGQAGTLLADLEGRILAMVLGPRDLALVPASALVGAAERLLAAHEAEPATLGAELQDLTPPLSAATGAQRGAIVAFVEPGGPAAGTLRLGDVIEDVQGEAVASSAEVLERVHAAGPGTTLLLGVRRGGEAQSLQVRLAAAPEPAAAGGEQARASRPVDLGASLAVQNGVGARVRQVAPGSAAARAGLAAGDVITWIGGEERPTPATVRRLFAQASPGATILAGAARDGRHRVLALEKR